MTSCGSLPTGTRAITCKLEGSTIKSMPSCLASINNASAGVCAACTRLAPSIPVSRTRKVSSSFIIPKHTPSHPVRARTPALIVVVDGGNRLELQAHAIALAHMQRLASAFVAHKELGIIVSVTVDTLPRKDRVIAGRQAPQRKASALIGGSFA